MLKVGETKLFNKWMYLPVETTSNYVRLISYIIVFFTANKPKMMEMSLRCGTLKN